MSNIVELRVAGMDCGACEKRLGTVLGRLDGVGQVTADHVSGRVSLRFDPSRTDADALTKVAGQRIEAAGFTVTGQAEQGTQS